MEKRKFRLQYATLVLCVTSTYVNYALAYCVTCNKCVWKWKQGGSDVRPRAGRQEFESSSGFFLAPSLYLDRFLSATCPVASDYRDWRPEREPGVCFVQCWYADNYACYLTSLSRVMFVWCINVEWNGYPLFQKDNSSWGMTGIGQRDCAPPPTPCSCFVCLVESITPIFRPPTWLSAFLRYLRRTENRQVPDCF